MRCGVTVHSEELDGGLCIDDTLTQQSRRPLLRIAMIMFDLNRTRNATESEGRIQSSQLRSSIDLRCETRVGQETERIRLISRRDREE